MRANGKKPAKGGLANHRLDESPASYSSPGWSSPEPDSASQASLILKYGRISRRRIRTNAKCVHCNLSQLRGSVQQETRAARVKPEKEQQSTGRRYHYSSTWDGK